MSPQPQGPLPAFPATSFQQQQQMLMQQYIMQQQFLQQQVIIFARLTPPASTHKLSMPLQCSIASQSMSEFLCKLCIAFIVSLSIAIHEFSIVHAGHGSDASGRLGLSASAGHGPYANAIPWVLPRLSLEGYAGFGVIAPAKASVCAPPERAPHKAISTR